ncbi:hypothetical protein ACE1AT_08480 [Pelatocladus sp. BLCC-F211]|uniref:hypothetical protein n=1 Tax=Pelatocladus sp. BLCC-F211 TaxID=3342752 RepID=UPI0035B6C57A
MRAAKNLNNSCWTNNMIIADLKFDELVETPNTIIGGASSFYTYTNSNPDDTSGLKKADEKLMEMSPSVKTLQDSIMEDI